MQRPSHPTLCLPHSWFVSIDYTDPNLVKQVFVRGHGEQSAAAGAAAATIAGAAGGAACKTAAGGAAAEWQGLLHALLWHACRCWPCWPALRARVHSWLCAPVPAEIATHTVDHLANPNTTQVPDGCIARTANGLRVALWSSSTGRAYARGGTQPAQPPRLPPCPQIVGARDWLANTAGVPKEQVVGFRAPYLMFSPERRDILAANGGRGAGERCRHLRDCRSGMAPPDAGGRREAGLAAAAAPDPLHPWPVGSPARRL